MRKKYSIGTGNTTLTAKARSAACAPHGLLAKPNPFAGVPGCAELLVGSYR